MVALYRTRWQIELAFKRLKSLWHIDKLPTAEPRLARVWLLAHLNAAVLTDQMADQMADQIVGVPGAKRPSANRRAASPWRLWQLARRILIKAILSVRRPRGRCQIAKLQACLTEGKRKRTVQADSLRAA